MTEKIVGGAEAPRSHFLREIVEGDLKTNKHGGKVVTRFPPEPNGYLHIGHAKSICLNFGLARDFGGVCHLRMDDTNPDKEDVEYVEAIQRDVRWLGFEWNDKMFYASDYYEMLYECAVYLIQKGRAYVCSLSEEEVRAYRGSLTEAGKESPYRARSVEENLDLLGRMKAGEFAEGAHTVRAKIDMGASNMKMRDPLLYRIKHSHHYRQGDAWHIYPMYDFAHGLSDAVEGITHSVCTLEFENNRDLYDWFVDACWEVLEARGVPWKPKQYEFARLALDYTVMSKRYLLQLVQEGHVSGWDDPRMPTIAGMRRRGYTPESIRAFCDLIGIAKANSTVDIGKLEFCVRDDLNFRSPRVMCVLDPLKVVLTNLDEERTLDCPSWPHDVGKEGSRSVPLTRELYIEREDFQEDPEPGFFRLAPGREVRLRYAHVIRCDEVVKGEAGEVVELRCSVDLATLGANPADGRKVKGTIHWVSATRSAAVEVRVYDRLFKVKNPGIVRDFREDINPASLTVLKAARIEPSALDGAASHYQFERHGYFFVDPVDSAPGAPVFNRVVDLKDSWAAKAEAASQGAGAVEAVVGRSKKAETRPDRRTPAELRELARAANPGLQARLERFVSAWGLDPKDADVLTGDEALADFYEAAVAVHAEPTVVAKWVVNEVLREVKERPVTALPFDGARFGRLVALVGSGALTATLAKEVFAQMARTGEDPRVIVEQRGLDKADDGEAIKAALVALLEAHPQEVARYKGGARNLMGFFTGLAMKATGGKAPAKVVQAVLGDLLG